MPPRLLRRPLPRLPVRWEVGSWMGSGGRGSCCRATWLPPFIHPCHRTCDKRRTKCNVCGKGYRLIRGRCIRQRTKKCKKGYKLNKRKKCVRAH